MTTRNNWRTALTIVIALLTAFGLTLSAQTQRPSVFQTTLEEAGQLTPEITTEELQAILATKSEPVFDVRTREEYAIAHIPGTINVYELEVQVITTLYPDLNQPMILYCNGPSCGKSKRTSEELLKLGYTHVRRYQLGLPVWRALSQTVQTDMGGLLYIFTRDHTSVFVDARTPAEFAAGTIPGAVNIQAGEAVAANDDGRLPFRDKSTRVVVFGNTAAQAKVVGAEVAKRAYWGSSYFGGTFDDLLAAGLINHPPVVLTKNAVVAAGTACTAVVKPSDVDAGSYDPDAADLLTLSVSPETPLGLGEHDVVLAATDSRGSTRTATAHASVTDQSGPSIGQITVDFGQLTRTGWVPATLNYTVADNCSDVATTAAMTIRGSAAGQVIDAHHVLIRPGLVYSVHITATDAAGNTSTKTQLVRAPLFGW